MDLQRISATKEITMNVPLHFVNEDTCPGAKAGGVITHLVVEMGDSMPAEGSARVHRGGPGSRWISAIPSTCPR